MDGLSGSDQKLHLKTINIEIEAPDITDEKRTQHLQKACALQKTNQKQVDHVQHQV